MHAIANQRGPMRPGLGTQLDAQATMYGQLVCSDEAAMCQPLSLPPLPHPVAPAAKICVRADGDVMPATIAGVDDWLGWVGRRSGPPSRKRGFSHAITG